MLFIERSIMTEQKARAQGDKRRHLELAGFNFYQVEKVDEPPDRWIVEMPTGEYLKKNYIRLSNALNAAEREINKAMFLYKSSINISENWQEAVRKYEGYTEK